MFTGSIFVSEAGSSTGFGHLTRQTSLVEAAKAIDVEHSLCVVDDLRQSIELASSIAESNITRFLTLQDLKRVKIETVNRVIFMDGRKLNIDDLGWDDAALAVILSPLLRIPKSISMGVFRGYSIPAGWSPKKQDLILLGPRYAVVPRYVAILRTTRMYRVRDSIQEICVFPGQTPSMEFWRVVCAVCDTIQAQSKIKLWVTTSNEFELRQIWRSTGRKLPEIRVTNIKQPWEQAENADLAITSGGQTLVEALCLGVPAIAIPVLESQVQFVQRLAADGACLSSSELGFSHSKKRLDVNKIGKSIRETLSRIAMETVDGYGQSRIIATAIDFCE